MRNQWGRHLLGTPTRPCRPQECPASTLEHQQPTQQQPSILLHTHLRDWETSTDEKSFHQAHQCHPVRTWRACTTTTQPAHRCYTRILIEGSLFQSHKSERLMEQQSICQIPQVPCTSHGPVHAGQPERSGITPFHHNKLTSMMSSREVQLGAKGFVCRVAALASLLMTAGLLLASTVSFLVPGDLSRFPCFHHPNTWIV